MYCCTASIAKLLSLGRFMFLLLIATSASAQIKIGINLSTTGGGASQGIPQRELIEALPSRLGGMTVTYVILDNASDPSQSLRNARKLVNDDKVDALIAGSTVPATLSAIEAAVESRTPQVSLAPVSLQGDRHTWGFSIPQQVDLMVDAVAEHMKRHGVRTVGFIGYADAYGDAVHTGLVAAARKYGLQVSSDERFARTDSTVTAQALRVVAGKPDAVLVGAGGTPAALPHLALVDRGYKGPIYHTHGSVNNDFLRVGGKAVEGALGPIGPVVAYQQLPPEDPIRKQSALFVALSQKSKATGTVSAFGSWAYDAYVLLDKAASLAARKAAPGTPEFRAALRDALEQGTGGTVATNGVYNFTAADHAGLDQRARVMVVVKNGAWTLAK